MPVYEAIQNLLAFGVANGLVHTLDIDFTRNMLLRALRMDAPDESILHVTDAPLAQTATPYLDALTRYAVDHGIIDDYAFAREQFAAHLMNLMTPPPSAVVQSFRQMAQQASIQAATNWFYHFCQANDYIRVDQLARNITYPGTSPFGTLEITINLSKPEKDPIEIARQKNAPASGYPKCMLCIENEGYAGRDGYPSHETLRTIPLTMGTEAWRFQYSPYAYYTEHCIVLNERHIPMSISRRSFSLLLAFLHQFPHYFIGSNADLPIVGGSILSHDHFQGGHHVFPMDKAPAYAAFRHADYPDVTIEAIRWPMTCLRLQSADEDALVALADAVLGAWRLYDDADQDILHETEQGPHNTITPIARRLENGQFCLQLVLRNNRTTHAHPLGIFHPHADLHHIKRENIGLIEVMGLFILPGRLKTELDDLAAFLTGERPMEKPADDDPLAIHYTWMQSLTQTHGTGLSKAQAVDVLIAALTAKCIRVLEDSGVYKLTPEGQAGLARFLGTVGVKPA